MMCMFGGLLRSEHVSVLLNKSVFVHKVLPETGLQLREGVSESDSQHCWTGLDSPCLGVALPYMRSICLHMTHSNYVRKFSYKTIDIRTFAHTRNKVAESKSS